MKYKKSVVMLVAVLSIVTALFYVYRHISNNQESPKTRESTVMLQQIEDKELGASFKIPASYSEYRSSKPVNISENITSGVAKNFERLHPQGFLSVKYETGLSKGTSMMRKSTLDFIEGEIENFFPNKYKNYRAISMTKVNVSNSQSLIHEFEYISTEGKPLKAKLLIVPHSSDSAYYFILQSHAQNYGTVARDMDYITSSLQLTSVERDR